MSRAVLYVGVDSLWHLKLINDAGEVVVDTIAPSDRAVEYEVSDFLPAAAGATPTLAEVLTAGNDPGANAIVAADDGDDTGARLTINPGGGGSGGQAVLAGGGTGGGNSASVTAYAGDSDGDPGHLALLTGNSEGAAGEALISKGGYSGWGGIKTGSGAPSGAPDGFLPWYRDSDTGELYGWDNEAWHGPLAAGATPTLAEVLAAGNDTGGINITCATDAPNMSGAAGGTGVAGQSAVIGGGTGDDGTGAGATVNAEGGHADGTHGRLEVATNNETGNPGESLNPDGAGKLVYGGVPSAAGVPSGAPDGLPPFAYDTTAVSGGFYFWNGSSWVKVATIL